ncbi:interferon alpha-inducible protein 27-like protein 2A [Epinephelus fuscoguttatus]|uniref:interferon alpha-inducible protein 27-like protein 2A n=1 Tax=Epinephelus fuscoguttatus TaxID=293821 RepID=UPI0020CFFD3A|nr:interferon alpha-inducible protein 27-like protein 2A [Epinephelus fuscoguttatus]
MIPSPHTVYKAQPSSGLISSLHTTARLHYTTHEMGLLTYVASVGGAGLCAAAGVAAAPLVLGTIGFTSAGIAAGSYAASMMSAAAVANGGGVAAGSLVAVLQAAGAAGLSTAANVAVASAGATVGGGTVLAILI